MSDLIPSLLYWHRQKKDIQILLPVRLYFYALFGFNYAQLIIHPFLASAVRYSSLLMNYLSHRFYIGTRLKRATLFSSCNGEIIWFSHHSLIGTSKLRMSLFQLLLLSLILIAWTLTISSIFDAVQHFATMLHSFLWLLQLWLQPFTTNKWVLQTQSSMFTFQGFQQHRITGQSIVCMKIGAATMHLIICFPKAHKPDYQSLTYVTDGMHYKSPSNAGLY